MGSLIKLLVGEEEFSNNFNRYVPIFSTNLRIDLIKKTDSSDMYVKAYVNNELIEIYGCGKSTVCEYEEFMEMISQFPIDNLRSFCGTKQFESNQDFINSVFFEE